MTTKVYERSLRAQTCADLLSSGVCEGFSECTILPIPTTRDGVCVTGHDITLADAIDAASDGSLLVGYGLPSAYADSARERGITVIDSYGDEEFLTANAELTAECALGIILTSEKRAPRDMKIGVVGYGRIGKCMTRLLLYLGASVTVYTRRRSVCLELGECGIPADTSTDPAVLSRLDILINTAPAAVFDTASEGFPHGLRVIDLASGTNFPEYAAVEKYPSVPARMFPRSAGRIWYESVKRLLSKKGGS